ncbi:MAG: isopenicillin N synthase family oxygenase [Chlamydiae bacterium]|nr:isopenicillin N synthase family oxygenase [Chlamydiota bacterium]
MTKCLTIFCVAFCAILFAEDSIEILALDVIPYESFIKGDEETIDIFKRALHENGIVGIKGIPGYKEKVFKFIESARAFSQLPENVKEQYAPNHELGETFLGYEKGKEKFKRPDGKWGIDDLKVSYYGFVPDEIRNKWPKEVDIRTSFQEIGELMSEMGVKVMQSMGMIGSKTGISIDGVPRLGRMLYYRKSVDGASDNPYWCGAHFDHSMFTALLPAFYFIDGKQILEPMEAGLHVKIAKDGVFKKVIANDYDVMLFQVGEFGQLIANDEIQATEHRVHKALGSVERYTMALFFDASPDTVIHSFSELTQDARYGGSAGDPCSYQHWDSESFKRYIVKEN